jgi:hypothetical protein
MPHDRTIAAIFTSAHTASRHTSLAGAVCLENALHSFPMRILRALVLRLLARRWIASGIVGVVVLLASCHDTLTDPTTRLLPTARAATSELDSPSSGSAEFNVSAQAPLAGDQNLVGHYPTATIVAMDVHQHFGILGAPPYELKSGEIGLAGRSSGFGCSHQGEAYLLNYHDGGGYDFAFTGCSLAGPSEPVNTFSDTVVVNGSVFYGYSYDAACPFPDEACAAYTGSSGVSISRVPATLGITGDSIRSGTLWAWPRREYLLTAATTPARMGRYATPVLPVGTGWTFAPDSATVESNICENGSGRICTKTFQKSGILTLSAVVNGEQMASAPLRVQMPALKLSLSADSVVVGDTVIATTTVLWVDPTPLSYYAVNPAAAAAIEGDAAGAALPPCLGTKPVPTRCYLVFTQPGKATVEVGATLDPRGRGVFALARRSVTITSNDAKIEITIAAGPNTAGSFTTRAGENVIRLEAHVTPASLAPQVQWSITDSPDDEVLTAPLAMPPATGASSSFTVPRANERKSRWPANHPGRLIQKALAYKAAASIVYQGKTYSAQPVTVKQDESDVLRQEYIDLAVPQGIIPARDVLSPQSGNGGDYAIAVANATFTDRLIKLAQAWQPHTFVVNGIYRDPVHNAFHVSKQKSSGTISASWHQYGCGADLQTFPIVGGSASPEQIAAARLFWDGLSEEARKLGFGVEQRDRNPTKPTQPYSGVGHVHVELKCRA